MATLPRRKGLGGPGLGATTPRRGSHGSSFGSRDHGGSSGSTPRGGPGPPPPNAWGRVERSSAPPPAAVAMSPSSIPAGDAYKVACRDRWINVTKTMMGERAEVVMLSGCTYDGVFFVLTPVDPTPGQQQGRRGGMYTVRFGVGVGLGLSGVFRKLLHNTSKAQLHVSSCSRQPPYCVGAVFI